VSHVPDVLPVLSRGKHRNPKRGACFMELASYLAGERWSDRPACTHPLLAEVARNVNDRISDEARSSLAVLIPEVIGLATDDPRADPRIALNCALVALPVAPFERQRALAVAVLACLEVLRGLDDGLPVDLEQRAQAALAQEPHATGWARRFAAKAGTGRGEAALRRFRRNAAHDIVKMAGRGVEQSSDRDRDELLHRMLAGAIAECRALQPRGTVDIDEAAWQRACALTT